MKYLLIFGVIACLIINYRAEAQELPLVTVKVSKHYELDKVVYSYVIDNQASNGVNSVTIGYDYYHSVPELRMPPLDWVSTADGSLPLKSSSSPIGWKPMLITAEENPYYQLSWTNEGSKFAVTPSKALSGFSVVVPREDDRYETGHFYAILRNGDYYSSSLTSVPFISLAVMNKMAVEKGKQPAKLVVSRTGNIDGPLIVNYQLKGKAIMNVDYRLKVNSTKLAKTATSFVIPSGSESVIISVLPKNDQTTESNESVKFMLRDSSDYTFAAPSLAKLKITDSAP